MISIKLKQLILSSVILLLVGCASEPMIKISEENQSIIEEKQQAKASLEVESSEANSEDESTEVAGSQESLGSESSASQEEEVILTSIDTSGWVALEGGLLDLTLEQFLPSFSYQIKQFGNGTQSRVDYVNFLDETAQAMQVESHIGDTVETTLYQWEWNQIRQVGQSTDVNPYINQLSNLTTSTQDSAEILLQYPLSVGSTWQADASTTAEITAIYQSATLGDLELSNIIEVTMTNTSGEQVNYFAQGEGLIAATATDTEGNLTQSWRAQAIYHDNRIINSIDVMIPTKDEAMIEPSTAAFRWQTNSTYASPFDTMLKELNILDDTITVNSVTVENEVATIDFTPGVVAVLNSYDAPEQAVIASIVTTIGNFFDVDQVRLTVSGTGMLPDTIEYPTNGIYQVSDIAGSMIPVGQTATESSDSSDSSSETDAITDESPTDTNLQ